MTGFCAGLADDELAALVTDLAGHDLRSLLDAFAACDAEKDRPSVVFAYTVKGWACRSPATRATTRRCSPRPRWTRCGPGSG